MDQPHFPHFTSTEEGQIPGRRTPLGAVGLGGFYFQGCPSNVGHGPPSDENNPDPSGSGLNSRYEIILNPRSNEKTNSNFII